MYTLLLFLLLLLSSTFVRSSPVLYLGNLQPQLEATVPSLGDLRCPNPPAPPFPEAWTYVDDTQSNIFTANQIIPPNTSHPFIVPAGHNVSLVQTESSQPSQPTITLANSWAQTTASAELKCETLKDVNITDYNSTGIDFEPVLLTHHGTTTIYAFSFLCSHKVNFVYVFGFPPDLPLGPAFLIKRDRFGVLGGTVSFFLSEPQQVGFSIFFGTDRQPQTCEVALFRIEPPSLG